MSLYGLVRPLLFSLDPETAHGLTLYLQDWNCHSVRARSNPVAAMGLQFPNPVGLAAGLDKNAEHIDALARLGFGFLEVGTVTPRPQPGNARPRVFRLAAREALINRYGFNNVGIEQFMRNVERSSWRGVLGINIGKNADTPAERAADDYLHCFARAYPRASYVTVNISSPNTKNLRDLQQKDPLEHLLAALAARRRALAQEHGRYVPLVLKVAPDLDSPAIAAVADAVRRHGVEGVIATNTSISREGVEGLPHAGEAGGLSGRPILARATRVLSALRDALQGEAVLIGSGGVGSREDAQQKFAAGASLVQLYTGLIYRGPELVAQCVP